MREFSRVVAGAWFPGAVAAGWSGGRAAALRPVSRARDPRRRRDGRGPRRRRRGPRSRGRDQDDPQPQRAERPAARRSLPPGGARDRGALAPQHRRALRRRLRRRSAVPRDGAGRRAVAEGAARGGPTVARRRARPRRPARARAGGGPRARHPPPRRQAGQRARRRSGRVEARRFRRGPRARLVAHDHRAVRRLASVCRARGARARPVQRGRRHLWPGRDPLRGAERYVRVRFGEHHQPGGVARAAAAAAARAGRARRAGRSRRRGRARDRSRAREPPDRRRAGGDDRAGQRRRWPRARGGRGGERRRDDRVGRVVAGRGRPPSSSPSRCGSAAA